MTTVTPTSDSPPHRRGLWIAAAIASMLVLALLGVVALDQIGDDGSTTGTTVLVGSGTASSETRAVPPFNAIVLAGSNTVTVHVGGTQEVVVRGDDNVVPHVTTEVREGTLVIGADRSFQTAEPLTVEVTVPGLVDARLAGSGQVTVEGVDADVFGATLPGSGVLRVSGSTDRLSAELSGSGQLVLDELDANDVEAVVSGSGQLRVHAARSLDANVSGAGQIVYTGDPSTVTSKVTGTGTVTPA
jgi:hypothetical protein